MHVTLKLCVYNAKIHILQACKKKYIETDYNSYLCGTRIQRIWYRFKMIWKGKKGKGKR